MGGSGESPFSFLALSLSLSAFGLEMGVGAEVRRLKRRVGTQLTCFFFLCDEQTSAEDSVSPLAGDQRDGRGEHLGERAVGGCLHGDVDRGERVRWSFAIAKMVESVTHASERREIE